MPYVCKSLTTTEGSFAARDKRLSICLRADGFSFAETTADRVLLTFGEAEGMHQSSMTGAIGEIKAFFAEVGLPPLGYAAMELVVLSDENVWVPNELFSPSLTRQYLKLVGGKGFSVMTSVSKALSSTSVFTADDQLATAFKVALPGLNVVNQHVKLSELACRSADHAVLALHWREGRVDVAGCRDGQYLYGNTLSFSSEEDALFRVIEVMKAFKCEGAGTEVLMMGEVDRERYRRFCPYFPVATLYTGEAVNYLNPAFKRLHTYRHALLFI